MGYISSGAQSPPDGLYIRPALLHDVRYKPRLCNLPQYPIFPRYLKICRKAETPILYGFYGSAISPLPNFPNFPSYFYRVWGIEKKLKIILIFSRIRIPTFLKLGKLGNNKGKCTVNPHNYGIFALPYFLKKIGNRPEKLGRLPNFCRESTQNGCFKRDFVPYSWQVSRQIWHFSPVITWKNYISSTKTGTFSGVCGIPVFFGSPAVWPAIPAILPPCLRRFAAVHRSPAAAPAGR